MRTHLRADLLRLVCSELPPPYADFIRTLPPDDFLTHLEAYVAVRRLGVDLPGDLRRLFVLSLLGHLDCGMAADDEPATTRLQRPPDLVDEIAEDVVVAFCGSASISFAR